ncbi:MAG: hypothetical protein KJO60_12310, partial [Desulfofustis sp.]|nr:hypothetical protein [Desulfofustis sp.]
MSVHILSAQDLIDNIKETIGGAAPLPAAVCFDFFDTLIHRSVPPEDTKKLAAKNLSRLINKVLN